MGEVLEAERFRRRLQQLQAGVDAISDLAEHLDPADQALVRAVYGRGMSVREVAAAARAVPRNLQSRLLRVVGRMRSPEFRYVLDHRDAWLPEVRIVTEAVYLRGRSQREAAARARMSVHAVRRIHERIRALCEGVETPGRNVQTSKRLNVQMSGAPVIPAQSGTRSSARDGCANSGSPPARG